MYVIKAIGGKRQSRTIQWILSGRPTRHSNSQRPSFCTLRHLGKGILRVGLSWTILHCEVKLGKVGRPSLLQDTQRSSSEMDQRVVVCEDLELGAQKVVAELLGDCPL